MRAALRRHLALTTLPGLIALTGCATFGGNVRGDFSCAAPDGVCAPSATIDDRALAVISSDGAEDIAVPAADGSRSKAARASRTALAHPQRPAAADAGRSREKVLRIVFQPYIDERGRLHEASAVHAVVAAGEWQQALTQPAATTSAEAGGYFPRETLAEAVDRVDPPQSGMALADPLPPNPEAVAAARARKADPIAAIKAEVGARLAPKVAAAPSPSTRNAASTLAPTLEPPAPTGLSQVPANKAEEPSRRREGESSPAPVVQPGLSAAGAAAVSRVKADPSYKRATGGVAADAREAAGQSGAILAKPGPSLRAPNFPAAVPGEN